MGMKRKKRAPRRRGWLLGSSATQVICISFVLLIALGTLLLTLPISSRSGRLGVVDAMFTATSATCVTGLVVRDTWTQFTPFGQAVVLLLIQVGGLGLVTLTSFFALAAKRRMGFKDLRLLGESVSASGYSQATDVLKIVVKLAMTFEIIGMVLLMIAFVPQFGAEGIWISAFTAISAFCNAGFDLFGRFGQYSSLAPYVSNYYVQAVIMFLIMAGLYGLGGDRRVAQEAAPVSPCPDGVALLLHPVGGWCRPHRPDGVEQPQEHGRAVRAGQGDGGPVPVGVNPYCRYEHHRPGRLWAHH